MPHVGVHRLATCHHQEHAPQNQQSEPAVATEERDRVGRVDRLEDGRVVGDVARPQDPERQEPDEDDGTEQGPYPRRPAPLYGEQAEQDEDGDNG